MKVIVYSQPDCGPCKMIKAFLTGKGVKFEEKDITIDKEAYDELKKANFTTTPVTSIDGKMIPGFNPPAIEKELGLD